MNLLCCQFLKKQESKTVLIGKDFPYLKEVFSADSEVAFWEESNFLLDHDKFQEFLRQDKFTDIQARVAWKILGVPGGEQRSDFL